MRRVREQCSSQNIGSGDCPTEAERMPVPVGSIEGIECARPLSAVAVSGLLIGDYMGSISWSLASSGTVAATSLVGHQSVLTSHAFPHSRRHHSRSGIREIENAVLMKWEAATSNNESEQCGKRFISRFSVFRIFIAAEWQIEHHQEMLRPAQGKADVAASTESESLVRGRAAGGGAFHCCG